MSKGLGNVLQRMDIMRAVRPLARAGVFNWVPDEVYLKCVFYLALGYRLNLSNHQHTIEAQWMKLVIATQFKQRC